MKHTSAKTASIYSLIPGLVTAILISVGGYLLSVFIGAIIPMPVNPVSPLLAAMLLGLTAGNLLSLPASIQTGVSFGIKRLLRFGIILMGIRVSILSIFRIGISAFAIVAVCITSALIIVHLLAKLLHVSPRLATLIAAGTSICGVSAIAAVSPAVEASEDETSYAIGTITLFGLTATIIYPYLAELVLHLDVLQAGFFLGTSIHDTSQVTAAALIYQQLWSHLTADGLSGADIAITTKLVRNSMMVIVIPILGFASSRGRSASNRASASLIPLFVLGYLAMGVLRSLGDWAFGTAQLWSGIISAAGAASGYVITVSIACIGLNTNIGKLKKLGYSPLVIGFLAALSLGVISFLMVTLFYRFIAVPFS